MNERIQELAEQAGAYFGGGTTDYFGDYLPPYMSITDVDLEKFAELIVRECIGCCDEVGRINQYHIKKDFIDPELGPKECIEVIKKHFGVEE
jgi:hypothetical protein